MSSPADDDITPEERAEYYRLLRRAEALPDVAEIAAVRAAATARPQAGVSDAEIYADEAFLLGLLAETRKLLGQMEALIGEPAAARLPLGWVSGGHGRLPGCEDEEAGALAELQALADGRADLLAQVAGIFEGTSEGEPDEPLARSAARLCRMAGADPEAIPAWIEEGRRRRSAARRPPFSGGVHGRGAQPLRLGAR